MLLETWLIFNILINKLEKITIKDYKKDISNEKLKFLHFCEFQKVWTVKNVCRIFSLYKSLKVLFCGLKKKISRKFSELFKPSIYSIYINNEQNKNFSPFHIWYSENTLNDWKRIIKFIKRNYKKTFRN